MNILYIIIGIILLVLGRRIFWLFVAGVGFAAGLQVAQQYFGLQPAWAAWAVATLLGLMGALMALFFQTIAIGIGGFAAGSIIAVYLSVLMEFSPGPVISLMGGIIGAILMYAVFDWALIGLSSVAGATLVVQALNWNPRAGTALYIALMVFGLWLQTVLLRRQHPTRR